MIHWILWELYSFEFGTERDIHFWRQSQTQIFWLCDNNFLFYYTIHFRSITNWHWLTDYSFVNGHRFHELQGSNTKKNCIINVYWGMKLKKQDCKTKFLKFLFMFFFLAQVSPVNYLNQSLGVKVCSPTFIGAINVLDF